tara:strand:- start:9010 stop:9588 length:579 start_codon:yes stop_codon:yes gene_type:complete
MTLLKKYNDLAAADIKRQERQEAKLALLEKVDPADIDNDASEDDRKSASKNVIMQIRRGQDNPKGVKVIFKDGSNQNFPQKACDLVSAKYDSFKKPATRKKFQDEINKSLPSMKTAMRITESFNAVSIVESLSPSYNNKYIGMDKADLKKKRTSFIKQYDDLIKFKKRTSADKEVKELLDLVKKIDYALKTA